MSGTAARRRPSFPTIAAPSSGCRLIVSNSSASSRAGFVRIASGTASLPMSWKSAEADRVEAVGRQLELLGDGEGHLLDPLRVAGGVRVLGLDGRVQRLDRSSELCSRRLYESRSLRGL